MIESGLKGEGRPSAEVKPVSVGIGSTPIGEGGLIPRKVLEGGGVITGKVGGTVSIVLENEVTCSTLVG